MGRSLPRQHIQLDFAELDDEARHVLVAGIAENAPQSEIYANNPAIQAAVAAVVAKGDALKQRNAQVVEDRALLRADLGYELTARTELDGAILALATMTEVDARSPADVMKLAFTPRDTTRSTLPPEPPESIDVEIPKRGHGSLTVSAHQSDKKRRHYDAEMCLYGSDTWTRLVGTGKTHTIKGPSGTQVWVHFATVRGELQSAWCTAVLVTIPEGLL